MSGLESSATSTFCTRRDARAFLWDVRRSADAIARYIGDRDSDGSLADDMLRSVVKQAIKRTQSSTKCTQSFTEKGFRALREAQFQVFFAKLCATSVKLCVRLISDEAATLSSWMVRPPTCGLPFRSNVAYLILLGSDRSSVWAHQCGT